MGFSTAPPYLNVELASAMSAVFSIVWQRTAQAIYIAAGLVADRPTDSHAVVVVIIGDNLLVLRLLHGRCLWDFLVVSEMSRYITIDGAISHW